MSVSFTIFVEHENVLNLKKNVDENVLNLKCFGECTTTFMLPQFMYMYFRTTVASACY